MTPIYFERDVQEYLPADWTDKLAALIPLADHIQRKGAGPGSLTDDGLEYHVVDGRKLNEHAPWLMDFYWEAGLKFARELLGVEVRCSDHLPSCVNLNVVKGRGGQYELHTDGEPYTALLFASTLDMDQGGALVLKDELVDHYLYPHVGRFVIFDGSKVPHAVEQLHVDTTRLSIPLVYLHPDSKGRPEGLDDHLYEMESE